MTDWDDFRYFLAVAEGGSLSAAARTLGVTQPTVGRRIAALESGLGTRLFERTSGGLNLTGAGDGVLELAVEMRQRARTFERRVEGQEARPEGSVRVAVAEGLGTYWLARQMPDLLEAHPGIRMEVAVGVGLADLLAREADVALRIGPHGSDELVGRVVGQVRFGLYASRSYLEVHGTPRRLSDFDSHAIIESTGAAAALVQAQRLRELAPDARVAVSCDNLLTQMGLARAGVGLLALPVYMTTDDDSLVRVLPDLLDVKLDLWLLTHRELRTTARIRAVMAFLAERIATDFK